MMFEKEIFINAFPTSLKSEVDSILNKLNWKTELESNRYFQINLEGQTINIPYRIYCDEPEEKNLTATEKLLLNCIFTRHHNGYIRENRLKKIITVDIYLTTPFIAQLLGEYVIEILQVIKDNLSLTLIDNLIKLAIDNPRFFKMTEERVKNYWACYYRRTKKADYPGFQILKSIKERTKELSI